MCRQTLTRIDESLSQLAFTHDAQIIASQGPSWCPVKMVRTTCRHIHVPSLPVFLFLSSPFSLSPCFVSQPGPARPRLLVWPEVVVDHAPAETFVRSENLGAHPGRALFLGGLEGTGHHFWMQVFRACEAQGSCVQSSSRLDFAHWTQRDDSDHVDLAWQMETQHNIPGTLILNGGDFGNCC